MRAFLLAVIVGLLTASASGISSLFMDEPCRSFDLTAHDQDDGACPPTCATCGCCAQAAEAVAFADASSPDAPIAQLVPVLSGIVTADSGDILHVPRPFLA